MIDCWMEYAIRLIPEAEAQELNTVCGWLNTRSQVGYDWSKEVLESMRAEADAGRYERLLTGVCSIIDT